MDQIPLECHGVYKILCEEYRMTRIGQANRRIGVKKADHEIIL